MSQSRADGESAAPFPASALLAAWPDPRCETRGRRRRSPLLAYGLLRRPASRVAHPPLICPWWIQRAYVERSTSGIDSTATVAHTRAAISCRFFQAYAAVRRGTAVEPAPTASCTIATTLGTQEAATLPAAIAAGVPPETMAAVAGTRGGMKVAAVLAKTMTAKRRTGSRHSQRNSQSCCQASSQFHSGRYCHSLTAAHSQPPPPMSARASVILLYPACAPPPGAPSPGAPAPESAAGSPAALPGSSPGGMKRRSSVPPVTSLPCGSARSITPPKGLTSPMSMALSMISRTVACICTCTPLSPSSGRRAYSAAKSGTTEGSHASAMFLKAGDLENVSASCARNWRTASSTCWARNGRNGSTSVRRPRSSLSLKKFSWFPMRGSRSAACMVLWMSPYAAQPDGSAAPAASSGGCSEAPAMAWWVIRSFPRLLVSTKVTFAVS
mmetsp:Transcript_64565/g.181673  ORF Transcript_64565/g.181673 Transcript_64565/m.181673 type:complete len:441 (-) Transcript_64565:813-2135(-)